MFWIIERVSRCKCLGIIPSDDMSNPGDSDKLLTVTNELLTQFNSLCHIFDWGVSQQKNFFVCAPNEL